MQRGFWERRNGQIEKLLCHDCEQRLSGLENYVKKYFYGGSHPIRLRQEFESGKTLSADYQRMKLFQLSLLWRASVASGSFFAKVSLPDNHANGIAEMLLKNNPANPDRYPCTVWRMSISGPIEKLVQKSGSALETMSFEPVARNLGEGMTAIFFVGGLV
jgi:hypothetical protein